MSSIMRRRSGLMGAWLMGAPGLEVRLLNPSILKPGRFPSHHLHHDTRASLAHACLRLARSAFVLWPTAEMTAAGRQRSFLGYCGRHLGRSVVGGAGRTGRTPCGFPKRPARVAAADRRAD